MLKVYVSKQSNYPVSSPELKKKLKDFFKKKGIVSDADVSVSLIGEKKMMEVAQKYLGEKNVVHNVLSFPANETKGKFKYPPEDIIHLGEIIICYPKAFEEANKEGKLIKDKIWELTEHGAGHLLGEHHK